MSTKNLQNPLQPPNYGLPLRPPTASTPLWAHILDPKPRHSGPPTLSEIPNAIPPPAPLDKNATSMRILLHDTQANLENFGAHVQKLVEGVKETKHEIKTTSKLFERDRERMVGDITDLVNRSQKEIQKAIGNPATNESVQSCFKDVTSRLTELDHRINAIQAFNQTHSQALQSQMQAVQILLDKQGSILTAVMPLLPLLQALPLHIDGAKTGICDTLTKAFSAHACVYAVPPKVNGTSTTVEERSDGNLKDMRKRKREREDGGPNPLSSSPTLHHGTSHKRLRTAETTPGDGQLELELGGTPSSTTRSAALTARQTPAAQDSKLPLRSVISPLGPAHPIVPAASSAVKASSTSTSAFASVFHRPRQGSFAVPTLGFSTPLNRRPLSDLLPLPVPPSRQNSLSTRPTPTPRKRALDLGTTLKSNASSVISLTRIGSMDLRARSNTVASAASTAAGAANAANAGRLHATNTAMNTPLGTRMRKLSIGSSAHSSSSPFGNGNGAMHSTSPQRRPTASFTLTSVPARTAAGKGKGKGKMDERSKTAGPLPGPSALLDVTHSPDVTQQNLAGGGVLDQAGAALHNNASQNQNQSQNVSLNLQKAIHTNNNKGMFGKERWSPVREGRRFIPLVDSEDDDEENE